MNTLYLYLGLGLVVMSGLALVLVYHRQIRPHLPAQDKDKTPVVQTPVITPPTAAELEAQLKLAYEHQINTASRQLGVDLKATSDRLSQNVERLTTSVIEEELTSYKNTLEEVRKVATETMEQIHQSVEDQRVELHQNMETELAGERKRLVEQFDARMGDIVSSYVAESLGGGVDLGSQLQYITQTLESNRDEIKKDLLGGV
jgi:exonuclease VII large subunit